ncbi:MAG: (deoxy)nucleoside triphosphate pyrophosphohydrolase [bacterium]
MKNHYEVVCAVIKKDDKYFICQRGPKGECGLKWEFPGGKIEIGETHQEALKREIKEELNSNIKVNEFITTVNHEYNTFSITMHAYLCDLIEGDLELSEHINKCFIKKDEFHNFDIALADLPILKKI